MGKQVLTEGGLWREGSAAPKLLPEELRRLPGELVTNDVDDPDKAHELDAPHVVKGVIKDFGKSLEPEKVDTAQKVAKKLWAPGPGERAPVTQWFVDVVRMRVISALVNQALVDYAGGRPVDLSVRHLWFPVNNVQEYQLRRGNPPGRKQRPRHLRDIDLVVDVVEPPKSIIRVLKERGIELDVTKALAAAEERRSVILV